MDKKIREKIMEFCKLSNYYCEFIPNTNSFIVRIKPSEIVNPRYILSAISDELLSLRFYVSSIYYGEDELEIMFHKFSLKRLEKVDRMDEQIEKKKKEYLKIVEELSLLERELYKLKQKVGDLRMKKAKIEWEYWKALDKKTK